MVAYEFLKKKYNVPPKSTLEETMGKYIPLEEALNLMDEFKLTYKP